MDDAIRTLLSQEVLDAFHSNLANKRAIKPEEIPNQLPVISIVLRKYFGPSAQTIENAVARKLYSKYGLEFERNDGYELKDYVRNVRGRIKPTPPKPEPTSEPKKATLPLKDDFDAIFLESIKETIEDLLGKDQARLALRFIESDVPFEKIPRHLPTFYSALKKNFGQKSGTVEVAIARKLYQKLSLEFTEAPGTELGKYIETALVKLSQREQSGFASLL